METPGRQYQQGTSTYRFSINGQEKESELNKNITVAKFWEYDSRIGRRWNLDPRPICGLSEYSVFKNSPIIHLDPNGDTTDIFNTDGKFIERINDNLPYQVHYLSATQIKSYQIKGWNHIWSGTVKKDRKKDVSDNDLATYTRSIS